jgi:hypothetical protein
LAQRYWVRQRRGDKTCEARSSGGKRKHARLFAQQQRTWRDDDELDWENGKKGGSEKGRNIGEQMREQDESMRRGGKRRRRGERRAEWRI